MLRIAELVVVGVLILIPQFVMASELDGDEFAKATAGVALAGCIVAAYKVCSSSHQRKDRPSETGR